MTEFTLSRLKSLYHELKDPIEERLKQFRAVYQRRNLKECFRELVFCLFTPQSNAHYCWEAVLALDDNGILWSGTDNDMHPHMKGVRFHKTKARRVLEVRESIWEQRNFDLLGCIEKENEMEKRFVLHQSVKGLGWKESSHYLRNVGAMKELAILDRHILRRMMDLGIIKTLPKNLGYNQYLLLEEALQDFSYKQGIPMLYLDMLFWYQSRSELFK